MRREPSSISIPWLRQARAVAVGVELGSRVFVGTEVVVGSGVLVGIGVPVCVTARVGVGASEVSLASVAPSTTAPVVAPVGVAVQAPADRDRDISPIHRIVYLSQILIPVLGFRQVELSRSTVLKTDRKGNSANTTQVNHKPVYPASQSYQIKRIIPWVLTAQDLIPYSPLSSRAREKEALRAPPTLDKNTRAILAGARSRPTSARISIYVSHQTNEVLQQT